MLDKVNLDGSTDPFYRYTRPKSNLIANKNGYLLTNTKEITHKLGVDRELLKSALCYYTSMNVSIRNNLIYFNGQINVSKVEDAITKFTQDIILCRECNNPETEIKRSKQRCKACGSKTKIDDMDLPDKIYKKVNNL